jgi:hypothetical protein
VLTGKQVDIYLGEFAQSRRTCPLGKSALARGMTSPADTAQFEGLTSAETIVAFGVATWVRNIARGMSISAPDAGQVTIDRTGNVELAGNGKDSRNGAMGQGLDAKGIGGLKPKRVSYRESTVFHQAAANLRSMSRERQRRISHRLDAIVLSNSLDNRR